MNPFDKIIGYAPVKRELEQIADILKDPTPYEKLGVKAPNGLLLHGSPGVGKSLMASALIQATGLHAFICRKDKPQNDFVNVIRETFLNAAQAAPAIVFLDDMDKFANGDEKRRDAEEYVTIQACMDEHKDKHIFVIATANTLKHFPGSLLRAGRFDRIIAVEIPHGEEAEQIMAFYMSQKPFISDMDTPTVAKMMEGCSCAELETVINEAGLYAGFERSEVITMDHLLRAFMKHRYRIFDFDNHSAAVDLNNGDLEETQIIYHEAGHALMRELLTPGCVTLVSTRGGTGTGGFVSFVQERKNTLLKQKQTAIMCALSGMAALDIKFGAASMGVSSDLTKAYHAAKEILLDNGIGGFDLYNPEYDCSHSLLSKQEQMISAMLHRYYQKAKGCLASNREFLDQIAISLAQKKLLTGKDIQRTRQNCALHKMEKVI